MQGFSRSTSKKKANASGLNGKAGRALKYLGINLEVEFHGDYSMWFDEFDDLNNLHR